tara:strand:- start:7818 stop:9293 length:1476 start_codon:yes stop_codon:yes gene_type:complete
MKKLVLLLQIVPMFSFGQNVQLTTNYQINHFRKNNDKPNVIFIMADDIGIGDISSYGAKMITTPNIDQLAKEGIKFNNYYANGAVCTPTRYSVLTGRYPFRNKKLNSQNWVGDQLIEINRLTIAKIFKSNGYSTAAVGKWHLGFGHNSEPDYSRTLISGPLDLGFDYFFGLARNHNDLIRGYIENDRLLGIDPNENYRKANKKGDKVKGLLEERKDDEVNALLTERALTFISRNKNNPFFLYFTPTIAHTHITPHKKFRGISMAGQYGDFIQELDFYVGKIIKLIDELDLFEKTIIIFTSDNGGQLKDHITAGIGLNLSDDSKGVGKKSKSAKIVAKKMGHRTNLNLKGGKGSPFEGGFRVPMILKWPNKINKTVSSNRLVCSADFFKTFASLFGQQANFEDGEDSFSFSDIFTDKKVNNIRVDVALYSKKAISYINKNWKLIKYNNDKANKNQLFNLKQDPFEKNNLMTKNPQKYKSMTLQLKNIIKNGH